LPKGHRLLTGWSLVRIRPGEPSKNKDLNKISRTQKFPKIG